MQKLHDPLSTTFAAPLSDPTRRAILGRLATGEATVTELAAPFDLSLPAISKHLKVLQRAGLVEQGRPQAQWRPCRLTPEPLHDVADWLAQVPEAVGGATRTARRVSPRAPGGRGGTGRLTRCERPPSDSRLRPTRHRDGICRAYDGGVKLTIEELSREAETDPTRIDRLVERWHPQARRRRSLCVRASSDRSSSAHSRTRGITVDQLERAVADRLTTFETIDLFYPPPPPRSKRTYEQFRVSLGGRARLLGPVYAALGFAEPSPDRSLTEQDEKTLIAFLDAWDLDSDEIVMRAARIMADAARRAAEGWVDLFYEHVSDPVQRRALAANLTVESMIPEIVPAASRVAMVAPKMLDWLLARHLEQTLHARNIDAAEEQFAARGLAPPRPMRPPAILLPT